MVVLLLVAMPLLAAAGSSVELSPTDAAQAIFPGVARPLQKYLRTTRQQPRYTGEGILNHLAVCIGHGLSAKAFIEPYLTQVLGTGVANV